MAIKGTNDLGNGKLVVVVDHDPTVTSTDAPTGSIIVRDGTVQAFLKLDDGSTTNVVRMMETATHLAAVAPANVTKAAAAAGAAATAARADHKHDVTTAAPSNVGSANAEGSSASLARADHIHNLPLSLLASLLNVSITEATGDITTTSATDVVATSMSATPAAGTYLVFLGSSMQSSNGAAVMRTSIYSGGTQVAASQRTTDAPGTNEATSFMCMALVTVNGAQAIDGRWRTTAGTATMHERQLTLVRVA